MLNRYQAVIPQGHSVMTARLLGRFFPVGGTLALGRMGVNAIAAGDLEFEIRVNGATEATVTIEAGDLEVEDALDVEVVGGNVVEVWLSAWPLAGLVGPAFVEVGVDDGVKVGGTDEPLAVADLVTAYYMGAFGRAPDGAELAADVTALADACIAGTFVTQVMARIEALVDDVEFGAPSNTVFVQRVYRMYFNREPDAGGQAFWEGELGGGTPRDAMRAAFVNHPEFVNRVALYCRAQLPTADARLILGQNPATFINSTTGTASRPDLIVYSTAALANGATEYVSLPMGGPFWRVIRAEADRACRIRAYYRDVQRTADAARPFGIDPTGEHGAIFDIQLLTNLDWDLAPPADGANYDNLGGVGEANAWVAITNLSGATHTVQIILHRRLL